VPRVLPAANRGIARFEASTFSSLKTNRSSVSTWSKPFPPQALREYCKYRILPTFDL
jgi:hypothetical protein